MNFFSGAAYSASCTGTGTGDCDETKNIVCKTNCVCTADSFRNTTECAKSKSWLLVYVVG